MSRGRVIERKKQTIRRVRTAEGEQRYGQPIGSIIVLDAFGNVVGVTGPSATSPGATRPGEDTPVRPDMGRTEAPAEAVEGHLRAGLPEGWEFGQEHGYDRERTNEQRQAVVDAARAAKAEVVEKITARMESVPDEVLLDAVDRQTHERLSRGDVVLLRKPYTTFSGEVRPGEYDYREVASTQLEAIGGDDHLAANGVERISAAQFREDARRESVNRMVALWAATSNGTNPRALTMQAIAEDTFGLSNVMPWDVQLSKEAEQEMVDVRRDLGGRYREFLLAQYAETQEAFRAQGITDIRLFRGIRTYGDDKPDWAVPGPDRDGIPLRPLSSFTSDRRTAALFAEQGGEAYDSEGYLMESIVPVERILSTPRTGVGSLAEAEFVVFAGEGSWDVSRTSQADLKRPREDVEPETLLDLEPTEPEPEVPAGPPRSAARMSDADGREVYVDLDNSLPVDDPSEATVYDTDGAVLGRLRATTPDPAVNEFQALDDEGEPTGKAGEIAAVLATLKRPADAPGNAAALPHAAFGGRGLYIDDRGDEDAYLEVVDDDDPSAIVVRNASTGDESEVSTAVLAGLEYAEPGPAVEPPKPRAAWRDGSDALVADLRDRFGVDLDVGTSESGGRKYARLSRIVVPKDGRSSGTGSAVMDALTAFADENDVTLTLTPDNAFGGTVSRLRTFYGRFGFVKNGGRNKDFTVSDTMYREPKEPKEPKPRAAASTSATPSIPTEDDSPLTITYGRNREPVGANGPGDSTFGQDIEPAGRYMIDADGATLDPEKWETGEATFTRPLRIPAGGGYADADNWKRVLSERYDGKTGDDLSRAVVADGYDAIVTYDKYGNGEIVDLGAFTGGADAPEAPDAPEVIEKVAVADLRKGDSVMHDGEMRRIRATPIEHGKASRRLWLEGVEDVVTLRRTAKIERRQQKYVPQTGIPRFVDGTDLAYDDVAYGRMEYQFAHVRHGIGFDLEDEPDVFDERILDVSARAARDTLNRHEGLDGLTITVNPTQGAVATANGPRGFGMTPEHASEDGCRAFAQEWNGMGIAGGADDDPDDTLRHVCTHELGHVINARLDGLSDEVRAEVAAIVSEPVTWREMGYVVSGTGRSLDDTVERWKADGLTANGKRVRSVYSMENEREFFAEAYLDAVRNGDAAADASKRILALVNKHFGGQADDTRTADRGDATPEARSGDREAPDVDAPDAPEAVAENEQRLFHGSNVALEVGDYLLPPSETGAEVHSHPDIEPGEFDNASYVYLTEDAASAGNYSRDREMETGTPGYVYEVVVDNGDRIEDDPENEYTGGTGLRAPRARIVAVHAADSPEGIALAASPEVGAPDEADIDVAPDGTIDEGVDVYGGGHQPPPPDTAASIDDLDNDETGFADVYEHPEWYNHGGDNAYDRESARAIRAARGKPDAMVTLYRAAPPGVTHFDEGNWVAVSEAYAREHAIQDDDDENDWPVYAVTVPARMVHHGGNDIVEYGYWGPRVPTQVIAPGEKPPPAVFDEPSAPAPVVDIDAPEIDLRADVVYMGEDGSTYEIVDGSDPAAVRVFDMMNGGMSTMTAADLATGRTAYPPPEDKPSVPTARESHGAPEVAPGWQERVAATVNLPAFPDALNLGWNDSREDSFAFLHDGLKGDMETRAKDAKRDVATSIAERMTDVPDDELMRVGQIDWYGRASVLPADTMLVRNTGGTHGVSYREAAPWEVILSDAETNGAPEGGWSDEQRARIKQAYEQSGGMSSPRAETLIPAGAPQVRDDARAAAVSVLVSRWAATSNDSDAEALALQQVAAELFDLDDLHGWDIPPGTEFSVGNKIALNAPVYRAFLRAQYEDTQVRLEAAGLDDVVLYRGVQLSERPEWATGLRDPDADYSDDPDADFYEVSEPLGETSISLRPMSSFSTAAETAALFAGNAGSVNTNEGGSFAYVMKARVPRRRILSTPRSGFGCLNEQEYVVLGGTPLFEVWHPQDLDSPDDTDSEAYGYGDEDEDA